MVTMTSKCTYSCAVSTVAGDAPKDAKSHHVKDKSGHHVRFENPFPSYGWQDVGLFRGLGIYFRYRLQGKLPVPDTSDAAAKIPTTPPSFLPLRAKDNSSSLRTTWLGHASCFVEFPSGFRALFDPVLEERFSSLGPKRFTLAACQPADFPALDAVFISHNHHDHLSLPTVKELVRVYPHVHFFVGCNIESGQIFQATLFGFITFPGVIY